MGYPFCVTVWPWFFERSFAKQWWFVGHLHWDSKTFRYFRAGKGSDEPLLDERLESKGLWHFPKEGVPLSSVFVAGAFFDEELPIWKTQRRILKQQAFHSPRNKERVHHGFWQI